MLQFQYISCYGLSLSIARHIVGRNTFQYISCYGLSDGDMYNDDAVHKFQYISCYGLSFFFSLIRFTLVNFNTSHVTVYRNLSPPSQVQPCNFNTSHVTVYPLICSILSSGNFISIHLMLRFISFALLHPHDSFYISIHLMLRFISPTAFNASTIELFQYISCYGLSRYSFCWFRSLYKISIHLMLRFISAFCIFVRYNTGDFNTSHVTVYLTVNHI